MRLPTTAVVVLPSSVERGGEPGTGDDDAIESAEVAAVVFA